MERKNNIIREIADQVLKIAVVLVLANSIATVAWANGNLNSYEQLECPSAQEFDQLARRVKLERYPDGNLCDDSPLGKLAKLLLAVSRIQLDVPVTWRGGAESALANPLLYISHINQSIGFDFTQKTTLAYNLNGNIYLGAAFFNLSPLDAMAILIHESRHSSSQDPRHVTCRHGDIPKTSGGCDEWLRVDDTSGAYAFAVSFQYGLARLAAAEITDADREFLIASALAKIGTRFNKLPPSLALPHDLVMVLDELGDIYVLHPFLHTFLPVGIRVEGERINRIEFNTSNNGLLLHTESLRLFGWSQDKASVSRIFDELIPPETQIVDTAVLKVGQHSYFYFLDAENRIWWLDWDPSTGKRILKLSAYQPGSISARRLIHGNNGNGRRYVIDGAGAVFYMNEGQTGQIVRSGFQAPEGSGWIHNTGGVLFDDLYGISRTGDLYYPAGATARLSDFQIDGSAVKYVEGITLRVQLDTEGNVYITRFGTDQPVIKIPHNPGRPKIVDVVVTRVCRVSEEIFQQPLREAAAEFITACNLIVAKRDPWLLKGIGINVWGQLVFEGESTDTLCLPFHTAVLAPLAQDLVRTLSFSGTEITERNRYFSQVHLIMRGTSGYEVRIWPYFPR